MDEQSKELQDAKVGALKSVLPHLKKEDLPFAQSLVKGYEQKGWLSMKQWYWVDAMTARATGTEQKPGVEQVGDFSGVIKLFKKAKEHIKYPKIALQVGDQPITLSVAGAGSKHPGTVNVTDGGSYGNNTWFGRVSQDGQWQKSSGLGDSKVDDIAKFLVAFGHDPAKTAKEYGKLTGRCCFCNSALTDEKSTAAGFGPVCADHYGLKDEWKAAQGVLKTEAQKEAA